MNESRTIRSSGTETRQAKVDRARSEAIEAGKPAAQQQQRESVQQQQTK